MLQLWENHLPLMSNPNFQVFCTNLGLASPPNLVGFPGHPADSGVGDSVGSCSNPVLGRDSIYYTRQFSAQFHDLVTLCSVLESDSRPSASELLAHPFVRFVESVAQKQNVLKSPFVVRQLRKTNTTLLTILLPTQPLLSDSSQFQEQEG